MCYDLAFDTTIESILDYFPNLQFSDQTTIHFDFRAHYQAQGYPKYPVIIRERGLPSLVMFEWGVIANYMDTPEKIKKMRNSMCNAQSEKILDDKRSVWYRLKKNRCVIPTSGIYEHREVKGFKNKIPYFVKIANRNVFFLPGLYEYSKPDVETGEMTGTFTLITRSANDLMRSIHNGGENQFRMPLFLQPEQAAKWIDPSLTEEQIREILQYELPSEELVYHTVFTIRGKNLRTDQQPQHAPFEWANLPPLGTDAVEENTLF
ncbi:MAG: SOS response-associated peptidase family protein [Chitinophagales bacterium]